MNFLSRPVRFVVILSIVLQATTAFAANNDPFRQGRSAVPVKQNAQVGQSTGAMVFTYPFVIPPGRNGMQPDLTLSYSSDDIRKDSIFGYGWSLSLPYIERVNKLGTNNLYNQDKAHTYFTSSLSGELLPLATTTAIGGSVLAESTSTEELPLIDLPQEFSPMEESAATTAAPETIVPEKLPIVDSNTALSFHTPTTPAFVYHPNQESDWNKARQEGARDAKKPIPGFPVAEEQPYNPSTDYSDIPDKLQPVLESLSADESANLKGRAIAKIGKVKKTRIGDYSIEIVSMEPIKGGVQVFARAWDKNGERIGFGRDGTVEIERFRIFNPPIMVPDGTKRSVVNRFGDTYEEDNYTEDPEQALLMVISHTISVKKERFGSSRILTGKVGNTTSVVYPNKHSESVSVDGEVFNSGSVWGTVHDATTGSGATDSVTTMWTEADKSGGSTYWVWRIATLFDTSGIGTIDTVTSATLSVKPNYVYNANGQSIGVVQSAPSSNTSLAASDFDQIGDSITSPTEGTTRTPISDFSAGTYKNISLNATGLNWIQKTGITKLGLRQSADLDNTTPGNSGTDAVQFYTADADTTNSPVLTVEHSFVAPVPEDLRVNDLTNPTNIASSSPNFSAIHGNSSSTALAISYRLQVSTASDFSTLYADSGKTTLSSSTPSGTRIPNITATTTFALDGTTYYWRLKMWDHSNNEGSWSTSTASFTMQLVGDYMAKVDDGSMLRYTLGTDGNWIAYDKNGWKYTFGSMSDSRVADPDLSSKVFRWYLEDVEDQNGNKVLYRYKKDSGQVYPDYIDYTDHGGGSLYRADFETCNEVSDCPLSYNATSSAYGFLVSTKWRVSNVKVKENGQTVRKYALNYTVGDTSSRALLSSIQETGYRDDGTGDISLPPTSFNYQRSLTTWSEVTDQNSWQIGFNAFDSSNTDNGYRLFDINGDALPDWVQSDGTTKSILLNNGSKWNATTTWSFPVAFTKNSLDQGVRMAEVNGDGLMDVIAASSTKVVYLNNGTNGWAASTTWAFPASFIDSGNRDQGVQIVDVNGDGLADVLQSYFASTTGTSTAVYINSGYGWTQDTGWTIPEVFINDLKDPGTRLYDINGDGLIDVLRSATGTPSVSKVYINNGRGFSLDSSYTIPEVFSDGSDIGHSDQAVRFADIDGDGRVDMVKSLAGSQNKVHMAGGNTFTDMFPESFQNANQVNYGVTLADVNGDGQIDVTRSYYDASLGVTTRKIYLKNGTLPDLLKEVINPHGGVTQTVYKGSAEYKDGSGTILNPNLPFTVPTVRTLSIDSGSYLVDDVLSTTTYEYRGGSYYSSDPLSRRFSGFGLTIATTSNSVIKTYFHQGNGTDSTNGEVGDHISKAEKPYRTEVFDTNGNLYSRTINKWARADYGDGRNFVKLVQSLSQTFDGDTTHRDSASASIYDDTTGNITSLVNYGEVSGNSDGTFTDTGTDLSTTTYAYATSSFTVTMSLPARETKVDQSGNTVNDAKWYYDNLALGSVLYGNRTKEERLISGTTYASTTKTYDAYGNVATSTDALGNLTGFTYDSYHLYPTAVRNSLGQNRLYSYDYSLGKPATTTDENNQTFVTVFDGFDRPIEEKQPDFTTPNTLFLKTTYGYTDRTTTTSNIFRRDYLTSATSTDSFTYLDGFDRTIQTKREAGSANDWITKDTYYNPLGKVDRETLAYFTSTSTYSHTLNVNSADNFNTYSDGDLTGQGGWTGDSLFKIQGATVAEGTKALQAANPPSGTSYNINKSFSFGTEDMTWSFKFNYIRQSSATNDWIGVQEGTNDLFGFWINAGSNGKITFGNWNTEQYLISSDLAQGVWHTCEMERRASDGYARGRIDNGSWSNWFAPKVPYTNMDKMRVNYIDGANGELWIDDIQISSTAIAAEEEAHEALYTSYTYDPVGRVITSTNSIGTTANVYSDLRLTTTDALGNKKDYNKDVYGNLTSVVEYSPSPATTTYAWDLNGKLTKITDAAGNIRNFSYDKLGRLLVSEDLHAVGDGTFGSTTRQYDDAGNVSKVFTPRGDTVSYTYDSLGRVLTENAASTAFTDVTNTYDSCQNGVGKLCQVTANNAVTTTYAYNPVGLVSTEAKKIGSTWATTSTSYFRSGAADTLTYPDNHKVAYVYNDAGDLSQVLGLAPATTTWNAIVESITYGPHGKPLVIDYGNNTKTTYEYDAAHLYRLTRKYTISTSTLPTVPEHFKLLSYASGTDELPLIPDFESSTPESLLPSFDEVNTTDTLPVVLPEVPEADMSAETSMETDTASSTQSASNETASTPSEDGILLGNDAALGSKEEDDTLLPLEANEATSTHLSAVLESLPANERPNAKGRAIAHLGKIKKTRIGDYSIEVVSMEPIDGGVQVFARAWDKDDVELGFGRDGTVEIERFRIINPPILVPDGTKHSAVNRFGDTYDEDNYTEDLEQALLLTLTHTISVKKERFDDSHIISGKIGNTTTTVYPEANPESVSVDGEVYNSGSNWSTVHDATTGSGATDSATTMWTEADRSGGSTYWVWRVGMLFDTSGIGVLDTVASATLSVKPNYVYNANGQSIGIVRSAPDSNKQLTAEDFDQIGDSITSPQEGAARTPVGSFSVGTYKNIPLYSTGLGWIQKTGITKLGLRQSADLDNTTPTGSGTDAVQFYTADAGTTNSPVLVVEHTIYPPDAPTNLLTNGITNPLYIATTSPYFSCVHVNRSSAAVASSYRLQVSTVSDFSTLYADSGKTTLSSSTPSGMRTGNLYATTTFPVDGSTYYWRIKLWDTGDHEGLWSTTTAYFITLASSTVLQDLRYTYDAVGNITNIVDTSGTNGAGTYDYQYDPLYRLTRASSTNAVVQNWLETYAYDSLGNITNKSNVGNYTYAGTNYANPCMFSKSDGII